MVKFDWRVRYVSSMECGLSLKALHLGMTGVTAIHVYIYMCVPELNLTGHGEYLHSGDSTT